MYQGGILKCSHTMAGRQGKAVPPPPPQMSALGTRSVPQPPLPAAAHRCPAQQGGRLCWCCLQTNVKPCPSLCKSRLGQLCQVGRPTAHLLAWGLDGFRTCDSSSGGPTGLVWCASTAVQQVCDGGKTCRHDWEGRLGGQLRLTSAFESWQCGGLRQVPTATAAPSALKGW